MSTKMKTDFVWDESHDRELSRIDRYLRYGTEMNTINCDRNSSFNIFLKVDKESKRIPRKKTLKSVTNLWNAVKDFEHNWHKFVANKIETLIESIDEQFYENAITFVIISLFECQKIAEIQSSFRLLSIRLLLKPFIRPLDVLVLCKAIGRNGINRSGSLRNAINRYYSQDFNDNQIEEILVFNSKFGNYLINSYINLIKNNYLIDQKVGVIQM